MLKSSVLLLALTILISCIENMDQGISIAKRKSKKGETYTIFYPNGLSLKLVTQRPDAHNAQYQLSAAAAYTDLQTSQPLDLLVCNGQLLQSKAKVGFLDGMLTIVDNRITITKISKGSSPSDSKLADIQKRKGTLLLQELLVLDGKNQKSDGGSVFQRRALVEFADHRLAVVESTSEYVTMKQFGDDLIGFGAKAAIYLDMGDWDEGWYRAKSKVVSIGNRRSQTARQSNWLIFVSN